MFDHKKAMISKLERLVYALEDQDSLVEKITDKMENGEEKEILLAVQQEILSFIFDIENIIQEKI